MSPFVKWRKVYKEIYSRWRQRKMKWTNLTTDWRNHTLVLIRLNQLLSKRYERHYWDENLQHLSCLWSKHKLLVFFLQAREYMFIYIKKKIMFTPENPLFSIQSRFKGWSLDGLVNVMKILHNSIFSFFPTMWCFRVFFYSAYT